MASAYKQMRYWEHLLVYTAGNKSIDRKSITLGALYLYSSISLSVLTVQLSTYEFIYPYYNDYITLHHSSTHDITFRLIKPAVYNYSQLSYDNTLL